MIRSFWNPQLTFAVIVLALSCLGSRAADMHSSSAALPSHAAKVAELERFVTFHRRYLQLDFEIHHRDNSGGCVPGPSDTDVTIVARVPPSELDDWIAGMQATDKPPAGPAAGLQTPIATGGVDEWYTGPSKVVGIDRANATVLYRLSLH